MGLAQGRPEKQSATWVTAIRCAGQAALTVADIPEDAHTALERRAERRGHFLRQYLAVDLRRPTEPPSVEEVLARIDRRDGGRVGLDQAVQDLAEERSGRRSWTPAR